LPLASYRKIDQKTFKLGYQSFEFDIRGNHIFVEGELNGKPARFIFFVPIQ